MHIRFWAAILVFATSVNVRAENIAADFFDRGSQVPRALQELGYSRFGGLDLATALAQMATFKVFYSKDVDKLNGNGRLSAHWQNQDGVMTIAVNPIWWKKFEGQQTVLAWHEYLGTLGFIDDQYWISVSMWFLSLPKAQAVLSETAKSQIVQWITKNVNAHLPKGTKLAGGVIGVGGGGEGGTLYVKMHALLRCLDELSQSQSQIDRNVTLGSISHYLSSPLTVTWGPVRR